MAKTRLFVKITRDSLTQVKDKYPFIYLERGRLEIDDSSLKWLDADGNIVRLPVATLNTILLGPGTSVTHEAIKTAVSTNCSICWVGEDTLLFYAAGYQPTSNTRNFRRQAMLSCNKKNSLEVAKKMFKYRFPGADLSGKSLKEMMGMEGSRIRSLYQEYGQKYGVGWKGRSFIPGKMELSDTTNKILTSANAALYGIICSCIHAMGYSPHLGFIHSGSPLPFVYDLADLYKEFLCIDLAFALTLEMSGLYNKELVSTRFRERVINLDLLAKSSKDIPNLLGVNNASSDIE